ncbi:MAG TPA: fluoride efflux transporter CrcB [Xanthobacteraceae bacterium]|nr:fluoride efflux transporter CrcB [Xanthobacteraceae bacterium]
MYALFLVVLGGSIGAGLRHGVNLAAEHYLGANFPWGTLAVNVAGSFLIGILAAWFAFRGERASAQSLRLFLTTGILGGFTTFSAFSLDFEQLFQRGDTMLAAGYVVASVAVSLLAIFAGLRLVRSFA